MVATSRTALAELDHADPLASCRDRFSLPEGVIYLDGNSLGALPRAAAARAGRVVGQEWGEGLIRSWNQADWINLPRRVGAKIAPLIGAGPDEVIIGDSTSINLYKLLASALRLKPDRPVILSEVDNFPTDLYVAEGLVRWLGPPFELRMVERGMLSGALDHRVALLMLTEIDYRTGERHDMKVLTSLAHERGTLVLWDLSHSAGVLPIDLGAAEADFAVGCGYKYLNGGPGAPAFLYVARRWQETIEPVIADWMGHARPFAFNAEYVPADGIARFLTGTPSVLALSVLDAALDVFDGVDMKQLCAKSMALTDIFIALCEQRCAGNDLVVASPREVAQRGSQVSFRHAQGYPIMQALIARGVIGDFRAPDLMRFGFSPLYVRYVDVFDAVEALVAILKSGEWREPRFAQIAAVT
ncbi:MAG: kynureninase [Alphaproteobacteria bacterium]|nr:kynureninase [Alphaproteobacteria bacterium]